MEITVNDNLIKVKPIWCDVARTNTNKIVIAKITFETDRTLTEYEREKIEDEIMSRLKAD